jgi:peptidoglycan L-alanyl-D-glutamate endopeptidase CwlK
MDLDEKSCIILETCHPLLIEMVTTVAAVYPLIVIAGHRGEAEQNLAHRLGYSQLKYPNSQHNIDPSCAIDICPKPLDWDDTEAFYHLGGYVCGVAMTKGTWIRWGGDWDMDFNLHNQKFFDLGHFELINI